MKRGIKLFLRPGERFFINGAVLRVDRKVTVELLNDATFLLESHVILPEQATSPLRQLYFILQAMLIDPAGAGTNHRPFEESHGLLLRSFHDQRVIAGLETVRQLVKVDRPFEALKVLRQLFPVENEVLHGRGTIESSGTANIQGHEGWTSAQ